MAEALFLLRASLRNRSRKPLSRTAAIVPDSFLQIKLVLFHSEIIQVICTSIRELTIYLSLFECECDTNDKKLLLQLIGRFMIIHVRKTYRY